MTDRSIIPFEFDGKPIRVIHEDGVEWFVARDVVESVDATWTGPATSHIPEQWKGVLSGNILGTNQQVRVLSEQGVYFYLNRSDKPKALPIQMWIAGEVLPQIRRTGAYAPKLTRREYAQQLFEAEVRAEELEAKLTQAERYVGRLTLENEDMRPAARALSLVTAHESITPRAAAKALSIKPMTLYAWLRENKWIHKGSGTNLPQQDRINSGYLELKYYDYGSPDGEYYDQPAQGRRPQVMITGRGMQKLAKIFVNGVNFT